MLEVANLSLKAVREHGSRRRSSEENIREALIDPLCVQTTALAWWVGGCLHAKRTASAEVVVVEGS